MEIKFVTPPFKELVTPEQYQNAQTHWDKLIKGQISKEFDMEHYVKYPTLRNQPPIITICGTAACSAGYLPETLNIPLEVLRDRKTYSCLNIFYTDLIWDYLGISLDSQSFDWLFSPVWVDVDNSAKGAGIRMRILYEKGLPENYDEQKDGFCNLMYADELKS